MKIKKVGGRGIIEPAPGEKAMTDDELVEKMARASAACAIYCPLDKPDGAAYWRRNAERHRKEARAALSIAKPILRNEALEEAALAADHLNGWGSDCGKGGHSEHIASAIRSLKTGDA
jgi:hypothetical protein